MSFLDYLDWRHIFNKFSSPFYPFERKLFVIVADNLDKYRRTVFLSNLSEVNRRTWGFEGSEVWYYKIVRFKVSQNRELYFKSKSDSEKLFSGEIFVCGEVIGFNVYSFQQKFSHITFSSDPRKYKNVTEFVVKKR